MKISGIGIDAIEIRRFQKVLRKKKDIFIKNTFSGIEQSYCFSFRDPAPHFAGTFAAKEAVRKASGNICIPFEKIEIRREKSGKPILWLDGRRSKTCLISITHNESIACAVAVYE